MALDNIVNYNSRTFGEIRDELIAYVKQYYPDLISDFNDSSVGTLLLELNAGVANNLSVNTDRSFQETQLAYATQRSSLLNIAKTLGFNIGGKSPSISVVDFTITMPVNGDSPDSRYYPVLLAGTQVNGGGTFFETIDVIDWSSPTSNMGFENRKILPNYNSNGIIESYNVTKREIVVNGRTNIYRKLIGDSEVYPFYQLTLPDSDVVSIESVILIPNTTSITTPTDADFTNPTYRYFEVDYLAQLRVFVDSNDMEQVIQNPLQNKSGKWIDVTQKFIKEYTANGFCTLTFGGAPINQDALTSGLIGSDVNTPLDLMQNYLGNMALGTTLRRNSTLYVKYRTGGGSSSNVGQNVINSIGNVNITVNGPSSTINNSIKRSLSVNNPFSAMGGTDGLSNEQIRNLISYNYASQGRAVTTNDYLVQVYKMPGRYGRPFRATAYELHNKIVIPILGLDSEGHLQNMSNSLLKNNISEYLSEFRMVNDYVEITDGRIYNIGLDVEVLVQNLNDSTLANNIIQAISNYYNISKLSMGQNIYVGDIITLLSGISGVINVLSVNVYNKVGTNYSLNGVSQPYDNVTGLITPINNTIFCTKDGMFEIKYPTKDIRVYLKKFTNN